jgi:hypothetical protein
LVRNQAVRDLEIDFTLGIEPMEWASWGDIQLAHFCDRTGRRLAWVESGIAAEKGSS